MATFDVFNMKREKVGSIDLADEVFGAEVREHLFYEVVKAQLASKRQGTQCAKNRSAVSGSTKKLYKQKGTGRARHGSIRAPIFVGGGQAHPPRPRDWSYEPPRRVRAQRAHGRSVEVRQGGAPARRRPLRARARSRPRSCSRRSSTLKAAAARRSSSTARDNEKLRLSIRNCKEHQFLPPEGVNVYDLLRHDTLILSKDAAKALEERCLKQSARAQRPRATASAGGAK